MRECMNDIACLLKRKAINCLWIKTIEENEAINDVVEIVRQDMSNSKLYLWSLTEGISLLGTKRGEEKKSAPDPKYREISSLFAFYREKVDSSNGNSNVFILRDLHKIIEDKKTLRSIRDFKEYELAYYNPIIVIAPECSIPDDVAQLFKVVDYDMPSKTYIKQYSDSAIEGMQS